MNRVNLLRVQAFASVLILFLSACAEDPLGDNNQTGKGHTITLQLSATVAPIPETKASIKPAHSGSEAEKGGFYYEMVSSDAVVPGFNVDMVSTPMESIDISLSTKAPATKAPTTLKNVYALLFASDGAFNGRANIGAFTAGAATYITFVDVKVPTVKGCQLVMVANDASTHMTSGSDWATAYTECKNYIGEGSTVAGQWRLPTQREIMMIWVLHPQLLGKGGFTTFVDSYWSCTEYSNCYARDFFFGTGASGDIDKSGSNNVRCVRDL